MHSVNALDDLNRLEGQQRLVAVFLATGYDVSAIQWLYDVWDEIHSQSGAFWHLIAPVHQIERNRDIRDKHNYNTVLARDLARMYGLSESDLPCLVLDSFKDDHRQLRIRLPPMEKDRRRLLEEIGAYIAEVGTEDFRENTPGWRAALNSGLFDHLTRKHALGVALRFVPRAATVLVRAGWRGAH